MLDMSSCIVRSDELKPCRTAFSVAHTPGFNIGAAGQSPKCRNPLHSHRTAEVFFVLSGRWRFLWGRFGKAGKVTLEAGDIINLPTGIFRGFETIGTDYGFIPAIIDGNDAGGGVIGATPGDRTREGTWPCSRWQWPALRHHEG